MDGDTVELGFGLKNGFHIDAIIRSKEIVTEALNHVFGASLVFKCTKKDIPDRTTDSSPDDKREQVETMIQDNPDFKKFMKDFEAEIIE